uniref:Elongation of very long chain fatty acids protein n=1 Tax=Timema monikensis TaxID=170555 RepID=A0A7R9E371_9NEOP|nr:unnamed protein product [Timema monikensis]
MRDKSNGEFFKKINLYHLTVMTIIYSNYVFYAEIAWTQPEFRCHGSYLYFTLSARIHPTPRTFVAFNRHLRGTSHFAPVMVIVGRMRCHRMVAEEEISNTMGHSAIDCCNTMTQIHKSSAEYWQWMKQLLPDTCNANVNVPDPRTVDWFLVRSPIPVVTIIFSYIYFAQHLGPKLMQKHSPFDLSTIIMVYNVAQIIHNVWILSEGLQAGWWGSYNIFCQPVDYSSSAQALRIFFVLRKKNNQITPLHVLHHSGMPAVAFICVKYYPGGHGTLTGLLNSFIHSIMYFYYLIAGLGPSFKKYLWWKQYLTLLQMVSLKKIFIYCTLCMACNNGIDSRTTDWFMVGSPVPVLIICMSYIYLVLYLGPKLMRNRSPFDLSTIIMVFNAIQIVHNVWMLNEPDGGEVITFYVNLSIIHLTLRLLGNLPLLILFSDFLRIKEKKPSNYSLACISSCWDAGSRFHLCELLPRRAWYVYCLAKHFDSFHHVLLLLCSGTWTKL